ncbi:MAG: N-acetyltransferase [Candidatus Hydrogenedentes bacterium]|nr:N-acetyltransferase [Candidatus Hydrogenedentota bacterium]
MVDKRPDGPEKSTTGEPAGSVALRGEVRKPRLTEVVALKALIDGAQGAVLTRELRELYENVRDFYVFADESGLGGCVALHIDMIDLAEVRTLVVRPDLQRRGIGRRLLDAVLNEAEGLDIARVYAFTREPAFFASNGFRVVDRSELPYKVFKDCTRCRLFPGCDETAMVRDLRAAGGTPVEGG